MPDITDIEKYFKDNNIDIENLSNIGYLLQKNNDILRGGLRSSNLKSFRTIDTFNSQDSLDATYPMYLYLNISDEMVKIVSIKLSFWLLPFRSYSTAAASGGGSTTVSGGGSTTVSGGGSTTPSGGGATSGATAGGMQTTTLPTHVPPSYSHPAHSHSLNNHTHTTPNHTHTTPNHTHATPDHQHATPDHAHGIAFGIYEESNSPTIGFQISRDNGATYGSVLGKYANNVANLEIRDYIETAGSYIIKFTSTVRSRLSAQITCKLDISAR